MTLKDNICYPLPSSSFSDDEVLSALKDAELGDLSAYLNAADHEGAGWASLSPGQKDRMMFARLFLHDIDIAFLDESTASLDPDLEDKMYRPADRAPPPGDDHQHRAPTQRGELPYPQNRIQGRRDHR